MNILLTGYRGFIGSHLLRALQRDGHNISTHEWGDGFIYLKGVDWVIHVGAITSTTERDVEKIMRQNYDFTTDLYDRCRSHEINFQFSSSASVYGLNQQFAEHDPVDPRTPYAWSKYLCERYILQNPSPAIAQIFRYFNVYGPENESHKGDQASPFYKFEAQAKDHNAIMVFSGSENYLRDFIHVGLVTDYHLRFLNCQESGVFNIGTGSATSFLNVAQFIASKYNCPILQIPMPDKLKFSYQAYTCADMTKTKRSLQCTHPA